MMDEGTSAEHYIRESYALQTSKYDTDRLLRVLDIIYGGKVPSKQSERVAQLGRELYASAFQASRVLYGMGVEGDVPQCAKLIAYLPFLGAPSRASFDSALQVRVDAGGTNPANCHALTGYGVQVSVTQARGWIEEWHRLHPSGLDAVGGHFRRPTVMLEAGSVPEFQTGLEGLEYDIIAKRLGDDLLPILGCCGVYFRNPGTNGEDYGMALIHDVMWGKASPPESTPVKPVEEGPTPGLVRWTTFDGGQPMSADVISWDEGQTWQR